MRACVRAFTFHKFGSDFDQEGITALHKAAEVGYVDVARMLLEKGADVKAVTLVCITRAFLLPYFLPDNLQS